MSVLLGLCDGALDPKRHRSSFRTNKAGGLPDWPPPVRGPSPCCRRCGAASALVVQVYCPVDLTPTHRNLHLFACTDPGCSGLSEAWTALRSQGAAEDRPGPDTPGDPGPEPPLPVTDWCDGADDWGLEEEEAAAGGAVMEAPCHQEEEVLEKQEPHPAEPHPAEPHPAEPHPAEPRPAGGELDVSGRLQDLHLEEAATFSPLFISVVEEADLYEEDDALWRARQLLREYESREGAVAEEEEPHGGGGSQEQYEKAEARHGDRVFGAFMKRISLCPQQVLRYRRGGRPLFVSSPPCDASRLAAPCGTCGAARTFELQLMPALVSLLQRTERRSDAQLEFGTVVVYSCSRSCWPAGSNAALEEFCFVQTDPDQQLFT